jgi:tetratricopeptide (TPR) repeat protein
LAEANTLYRASRHSGAERLLHDLLRDAVADDDVESQARIHNNLGFCATHLSDFAKANIHFSEAVAKFTDLGFFSEVPRTERGAGLVLIARGQTTAGLARLRQARRAFSEEGMVEEAGLCALSIAATLIDRGDFTEARALTRRVAEEFKTAGIDQRAITAIVDLCETIDADDVTAEAVHTVHAFVERLSAEAAC